MRTPVYFSSTGRRRLLIASCFVCIAVVGGVQASTGAGSHAMTLGAASAEAATDAGSAGTTPANQPALDQAADDAKSVAGAAYYTDARVDDAANAVDVYLADAPQSIIDQLQAMHPGTYVINNDAAHPLSQLLQVEHSLSLTALQSAGINAVVAYPTSDGHLKVGVTSNSDSAVQAAQSALDSSYGAGLIQVYPGAQRVTLAGYRYNESAPWNAGDFITHTGTDRFNGQSEFTDCSSGISVHKNGDPSTTYMLTAAHCFWIYGSNSNPAIGTIVHNGYKEAGGTTLFGSGTTIGSVSVTDNDGNGQTSNDAALISASTGYDVFKSGWNSTEITAVSGTLANHSGDMGVCDSGAYDGAICGLEVENLSVKATPCVVSGDCFTIYGNTAWNPASGSTVAASNGDSGGPVYSIDSAGDAQARGMIVGGVSGSGTTCTSNPPTNYPATTCDQKLFFVGMATIAGDLNVSTNIK
jgi:hypothetical protein